MNLWQESAVIFGAAFAAGMVNSVAGGGTLISFPTLVWLGRNPILANTTNAVALWPGALAGMFGYRRELKGSRRWIILLSAPSLVGGIVGAAALLGINYSVAIIKFKSRRFESLIEGNPLKIIENSKVDENAVRRELLTKEDLDTIAHREGLDSADDIEKCVLDPNGDFLVAGNTRTSEENFRSEVLKRLEDLTHQLKELKGNS